LAAKAKETLTKERLGDLIHQVRSLSFKSQAAYLKGDKATTAKLDTALEFLYDYADRFGLLRQAQSVEDDARTQATEAHRT
jgi:hypothetical protein